MCNFDSISSLFWLLSGEHALGVNHSRPQPGTAACLTKDSFYYGVAATASWIKFIQPRHKTALRCLERHAAPKHQNRHAATTCIFSLQKPAAALRGE